MNRNTARLHDLGQRLWLDNITRALLTSGTLARYIAELSVTGLTSNPTIFERAIGGGSDYDVAILKGAALGLSDEGIFFELALADLTAAAEMLRPIFDASGGRDGWVSLEVSPLLANDTANTIFPVFETDCDIDKDNNQSKKYSHKYIHSKFRN